MATPGTTPKLKTSGRIKVGHWHDEEESDRVEGDVDRGERRGETDNSEDGCVVEKDEADKVDRDEEEGTPSPCTGASGTASPQTM